MYILLYYTRLPLNLANKQQASSKQPSNQVFLVCVLANALPHCSGLYSTLATLEHRSCPCQIQVLSQKKLTSGPPGEGAKLGGALTKLRILCPKRAFFWPKSAPKPSQK